jgi:hypothetical protein
MVKSVRNNAGLKSKRENQQRISSGKARPTRHRHSLARAGEANLSAITLSKIFFARVVKKKRPRSQSLAINGQHG